MELERLRRRVANLERAIVVIGNALMPPADMDGNTTYEEDAIVNTLNTVLGDLFEKNAENGGFKSTEMDGGI